MGRARARPTAWGKHSTCGPVSLLSQVHQVRLSIGGGKKSVSQSFHDQLVWNRWVLRHNVYHSKLGGRLTRAAQCYAASTTRGENHTQGAFKETYFHTFK